MNLTLIPGRFPPQFLLQMLGPKGIPEFDLAWNQWIFRHSYPITHSVGIEHGRRLLLKEQQGEWKAALPSNWSLLERQKR